MRKTKQPRQRWDGERLKALIDERKLTTTRVGADLGKSESSVRAWCKGSTPTVKTLIKIAEYFGVPISYFLVRS